MPRATRPCSTATIYPAMPAVDQSSTELAARLLAALGVTGIALIHIADAPDAYRSARYIFWLYMVLVALSVPMITLLLHWRSPRVWAATTTLAAAPFFGYLLSRSIGLPGDSGEIGNWVNPAGMASLFVEGSLIVLSLIRLRLLLQPAGSISHTTDPHHGVFIWPLINSRLSRDGSRSRSA